MVAFLAIYVMHRPSFGMSPPELVALVWRQHGLFEEKMNRHGTKQKRVNSFEFR